MLRKGSLTVALDTEQSERELLCFLLHPKGWMQTRAAPKCVSGTEQDRGPREDNVRETTR